MTSLKTILPRYLRTPRLTLELFDYSPTHYECLLASINSNTAHRNMGDFGIRATAAFDELLTSARVSPSTFPNAVNVDIDVYYLMHLGNEDGPLMGGVSLAQRSRDVPPDMGWCVLEEYHQHGYATEAAKELLRMVHDDLGIQEVIAWPGQHNLPSQKVAQRAGFVEGGIAKDEHGESCVIYQLPGMKLEAGLTLSLYGK